MLTANEFNNWAANNNIEINTARYINVEVRNAQPARNVNGRRHNVTGKYSSKKMGVTIQYESRLVELPAIHLMEYDDEVLEYYDQPNKIKIKYFDEKTNRNRGYQYTPDFFIIKNKGAGWEEWKTEEDLIRLSSKKPWLYTLDDQSRWRCPPAEEFANERGLFFRVRSDKEFNWKLNRNLVFLDSYLKNRKSMFNESDSKSIQEIVKNNRGITLQELIKEVQTLEIKVDSVYECLINGHIYIDLNSNILADTKNVLIFLTSTEARIHQKIIDNADYEVRDHISKVQVKQGEDINWDGVIWSIINVGLDKVSLKSNTKLVSLTLGEIETLINTGQIKYKTTQVVNDNDYALEIIRKSSEEDLIIASEKLEYVKKYNKGIYTNPGGWPKPRTVRLWVKEYKKAKEIHGNGFLGLLPKTKEKGNREPRFSSEVLELMDQIIEENYENITQKNAMNVYGTLQTACENKGYTLPSYVTFCNRIKERPRTDSVRNRMGERANYQVKEFNWLDYEKTPRHGDFPFNICHLDHTQLDIEIVSSKNGKVLGKPWLSLMVDAFSRRVVAFYLSFNNPSSISCLMAYRDCVQRYNRLPETIVVDNAKEFRSIYFQSLVAKYEGDLRYRPAAEPRVGSVLERLFGTANSKLIHNLPGNTKIMKNVRMVTKSVNPKNNASVTLMELYGLLNNFFFELYDNSIHPSLEGLTPREAFEEGNQSGEREHSFIKYDKKFEILTMPATKKGEAKVNYNRGVKVNNRYYWNNVFKDTKVGGTSVKIRFDPFNLGHIYAYVKKEWIECKSNDYEYLSGIGLKESQMIFSELRKIDQSTYKTYMENAKDYSNLIDELIQGKDAEKLDLINEQTREEKALKSNNTFTNEYYSTITTGNNEQSGKINNKSTKNRVHPETESELDYVDDYVDEEEDSYISDKEGWI